MIAIALVGVRRRDRDARDEAEWTPLERLELVEFRRG